MILTPNETVKVPQPFWGGVIPNALVANPNPAFFELVKELGMIDNTATFHKGVKIADVKNRHLIGCFIPLHIISHSLTFTTLQFDFPRELNQKYATLDEMRVALYKPTTYFIAKIWDSEEEWCN